MRGLAVYSHVENTIMITLFQLRGKVWVHKPSLTLPNREQ